MKDLQQISGKAKAHLIGLYKARENENTPFHTLDKSLDLVETSQKIAEKSGVDDEAMLKITLAAFFLYTGYWQHTALANEMAVEAMKSFVADDDTDHKAEKISKLMLSVEDDSEDKNIEEQVLYDAHYSFLGQKKLNRKSKQRALELNPEEDLLNEYRRVFELISNHKYRTAYAIEKFGQRKAKNSQKLLETIQKEEAKNKKRKRKSRKLGRGIETMYRTIYRNHINLSSIADAKANLIIRVNTIILSIIITLGGTGYTFFEQGFFKYSRFTIPVMVFVAGSLLAVIFAILSARPKVTNKEVSKKRLLGKESSILFFGNFTALDKKDFVREMSLFRKNDDRVYDSMSVDMYYLGLVLDKKYKLVKYSYNTFMIGLTLSVLSFMAIFMLFQFSQ